jgi:hypothetical protein
MTTTPKGQRLLEIQCPSFFGINVHSEGARQGGQYLNMPSSKKVKMFTKVLEYSAGT